MRARLLHPRQTDRLLHSWIAEVVHACFRFEGAVCIGICTAAPQPTAEGKMTNIHLNPPGDTVIEDGDQLIFIAEDDDTYECAPTTFVNSMGITANPSAENPAKKPTR